MLERDIEKYLVKRVAGIGGIAYKFTSPSNRGVFDRVVVMPRGVVWFVELKSAKGKLSKLQEKFEREMQLLGHKTAVLHSKDAVDTFIHILEQGMQ
tara:strand:+ start:543 stop:830 length:288 start_codon:yes stop_codon:yes gene_type:complete